MKCHEKEEREVVTDFCFGDFVVICQEGGPRFQSVLQGETAATLAGTQCCLTLDYFMINAHALSI